MCNLYLGVNMIRILCYGDSNTWGFIPGSNHQRFNERERWTRVLQNKLKNEYEVIEEGLNGRTLFSENPNPGKEGKSGFMYLKPCMETHDKIDIVILMLGTNELKTMYGNSPENIFNMFQKLVNFILAFESKIDGTKPKLIVSGIPLVEENELNKNPEDKYFGAPEKSKIVCELYSNFCKTNNIIYIDNTDLKLGIDGVHIDLDSHKKLAEKLYKTIKNQ